MILYKNFGAWFHLRKKKRIYRKINLVTLLNFVLIFFIFNETEDTIYHIHPNNIIYSERHNF